MNTELQHFICQMDAIRHGNPWLGLSFKGLLSRIDEKQAFISHQKGIHSSAQLIAHLILWHNEALQRLNSGQSHSLDNDPRNWPSNEALQKKGWTALLNEFDKSWMLLKEHLKTEQDLLLQETYLDADFKERYTFKYLLEGLLQHEIYHMGQLAIAIKLV